MAVSRHGPVATFCESPLDIGADFLYSCPSLCEHYAVPKKDGTPAIGDVSGVAILDEMSLVWNSVSTAWVRRRSAVTMHNSCAVALKLVFDAYVDFDIIGSKR